MEEVEEAVEILFEFLEFGRGQWMPEGRFPCGVEVIFRYVVFVRHYENPAQGCTMSRNLPGFSHDQSGENVASVSNCVATLSKVRRRVLGVAGACSPALERFQTKSVHDPATLS